MITQVFFYGSLQSRFKGFRRYVARFHPMVAPATIGGKLYDLVSFAALQDGEGTVKGEIMRFPPEAFGEILEYLDRLLGFREGRKGNRFVRHIRRIRDADGAEADAYVYLYPHPVSAAVESGDWESHIRLEPALAIRLLSDAPEASPAG